LTWTINATGEPSGDEWPVSPEVVAAGVAAAGLGLLLVTPD